MKNLKIKIIFWYFFALMGFIPLASMKEAKAFDSELSQAFAEFIKIIYTNTQTKNSGNLICSYGSDEVSSYLVKSKNAVVINDDTTNYKACRIIYVSRSKEKFVKSFIDTMNKSGALTLATFDSFVVDGGMVFIDLGRRDFELTVNSTAFKKSGAKLDSSITALIINTKSRQ